MRKIIMKAKLPNNKKELDKYYAVRYKGNIVSYLSPSFAIKRNATTQDLNNLKKIHRKKYKLFDQIREEEDPKILHELAKQLESIEFELQDAWGFERDANYHTWWYRTPKCTCGRMDNMDALGTPYKNIDSGCPLHSIVV